MLESKVGGGSTFTVFFPEARMEIRKERAKGDGAPRGAERILFVDDEPAIVKKVSRTLEHLGYNVTGYVSARLALEAFLKEPFQYDLVITDQTMPGMTGIEMAEKMLLAKKGLPILLITGQDQAEAREKASSLGIEVLMKPILKREIAETIRRLLNRAEVQRQ